jgi:hypothetical protein
MDLVAAKPQRIDDLNVARKKGIVMKQRSELIQTKGLSPLQSSEILPSDFMKLLASSIESKTPTNSLMISVND